MVAELRVGIVGLGAASRQVVPGFGQAEGVRFTAACDIRPEAVQQFTEHFGVEGFTSVEEMCQHAEMDVLYVATPNALHAPHTIVAAEHGKHVICEKPMAITMDEANRMVEAVEKNGVRYVQGHSKIYRPPIHKMGEVIASGRLGRVIQINTWNYNDWLRRPWEAASFDPQRGGGIVYRQGPHQMDIVRYLAGGVIRSLRGTAGRWNPYFDVEGDYSAFLDFEDGVTALLAFNGYGHLDIAELTWGLGEGGNQASEEKLYGPRRKQTAPATPEEVYSRPAYGLAGLAERGGGGAPRFQDFFGLTVVSCERGDIRQSPNGLYVYTEDGREEVAIDAKDNYRGSAELRELQESMEQNRPVFPGADWGRASLEACIAIIQSSRERREVPLQYQCPSPIRVHATEAAT